MSIAKLLSLSATLITRREGEDEDAYGAKKPDVEETSVRCELQQVPLRRSGEPDEGGEASDTLWTGFFPAGTDLRTADAVVVEGRGKFELVGEPWHARNPRTGQESHLEAKLRRTAGSDDSP